jgi:hypothetical protein
MAADVSDPEEVPQPRLPASDPTPSHSNTLQFSSFALPIRVHVPTWQCLPLSS